MEHHLKTDPIIRDLAFIDGAQIFHKKLKEAADKHIPIIPLTSSESILTAPFRASLIVNLLDILEWKHFAIITSNNEDSLYIVSCDQDDHFFSYLLFYHFQVKILGQLTTSEQICIGGIFDLALTHSDHLSDGVDELDDKNDHKILDSDRDQLRDRLNTFIEALDVGEKKIPILIIGNDQNELSVITKIFYENLSQRISNHPLFFSNIPSPELLDQLRRLASLTKIVTLTSRLPDIPLLEETKV